MPANITCTTFTVHAVSYAYFLRYFIIFFIIYLHYIHSLTIYIKYVHYIFMFHQNQANAKHKTREKALAKIHSVQGSSSKKVWKQMQYTILFTCVIFVVLCRLSFFIHKSPALTHVSQKQTVPDKAKMKPDKLLCYTCTHFPLYAVRQSYIFTLLYCI